MKYKPRFWVKIYCGNIRGNPAGTGKEPKKTVQGNYEFGLFYTIAGFPGRPRRRIPYFLIISA